MLIDEERLPGRQGRLVFAYLVSESVGRDPRELAEALWGEEPPPTWEKALGVIASKLRALLAECGIDGAKALSSSFGCYRLELPAGSQGRRRDGRNVLAEAEAALAAGDSDTASTAASLAASLVREPLLPGEDAVWVEGAPRADRSARSRTRLSGRACRAPVTFPMREVGTGAIGSPFRESGYRGLRRHTPRPATEASASTYDAAGASSQTSSARTPRRRQIRSTGLLATTPGHQDRRPSPIPHPRP